MSRWLTAAELIEVALPALPADKGGLSRLIMREGWRASHLAREGERGWEYSSALLPAEAQAALLARELAVASSPQPSPRRSLQAEYVCS